MTSRNFYLSLLIAAVVVVAVHFLQFPGSVPDFRRASNGGVLLDVKPSFSQAAIYVRLEKYGANGRDNYAFRNTTVDVLLPLTVFPFLFFLGRRADRRTRLPHAARVVLLSLPFIYVGFDLAENASVLGLLSRYPERLDILSAVLPYFTVIKRAASMLALLAPIGLLAYAAFHRKPPTVAVDG